MHVQASELAALKEQIALIMGAAKNGTGSPIQQLLEEVRGPAKAMAWAKHPRISNDESKE